MRNNTRTFNKDKFKSKKVAKFEVRYKDGTYRTVEPMAHETVFFKENFDNIYISIRRDINETTSVTEHIKFFKNDLSCYFYAELPCTKKEIENGEE